MGSKSGITWGGGGAEGNGGDTKIKNQTSSEAF